MEYADLVWDHDAAAHEAFVAHLAPIVLFTYNRLEHTRKTVEALQKNVYAKESRLYIYSDAPKNEKAAASVQAVRDYLHTVTGFREVTVIEREENWGLAENIIDGVTKLVNAYGKIIVLEDDIVTSKWFLKYMNDALEVYQDEERVMEVNGYIFPYDHEELPECYFLELDACWGWATWARSWKHFRRDPEGIRASFTHDDIFRFNLDGTDESRWEQVEANCTGDLYTWAIFWAVAIFRQHGVALFPRIPMARNIGLDGSGEHCGTAEFYEVAVSEDEICSYPLQICAHAKATERLLAYKRALQPSWLRRRAHSLKRRLKYLVRRT